MGAKVSNRLDEIAADLASIGTVEYPEELAKVARFHAELTDMLDDSTLSPDEVARVNDLMSKTEDASRSNKTEPDRVDPHATEASDAINKIFDDLEERIRTDTVFWENDPDNDFSLQNISDRWRKKNIIELFSTGGIIPRTVMRTRVGVEGSRIVRTMIDECGSARTARLKELKTVGLPDVQRNADADVRRILKLFREAKAAGESHLRAFEKTYYTYFKYVNLTQIFNQYFYGLVFFGGLDLLKKALLGRITRLSPLIRVPLLKSIAAKAEKSYTSAVWADNPHAAYAYALTNATADTFAAENIFKTGLKPVGGKFIPPLNETALGKGLVYSKTDWARLTQQMVLEGRFLPYDKWLAVSWKAARQRVLGNVAKWEEGGEVFKQVVGHKYGDEGQMGLFNSGIVAPGLSLADIGTAGLKFFSSGVAAARNFGVSYLGNELLGGQGNEIDVSEQAIRDYLDSRITARVDEIKPITQPDWAAATADFARRIKSGEVITVSEAEDKYQSIMDAHAAEITDKMEEIVNDEVQNRNALEIVEARSGVDVDSQGWLDKMNGLYEAVYQATDVDNARAILGELVSAQASCPEERLRAYGSSLVALASARVEKLGDQNGAR